MCLTRYREISLTNVSPMPPQLLLSTGTWRRFPKARWEYYCGSLQQKEKQMVPLNELKMVDGSDMAVMKDKV